MNLAETILGLQGKVPWGVRLGHGSFLTLEFGKKASQKEANGIAHGEWHLWLYMCNWRIEFADKILAGSADSRKEIQKALDATTFDKITEIQLASPSLDLVIQFGTSLRILTFSSSSGEADQWWLFTPDGNCLRVHGGGKYVCGNKDEPG